MEGARSRCLADSRRPDGYRLSIDSASSHSYNPRMSVPGIDPTSAMGELVVEDLAAASEINVDTIRYYQRLGLLEPPRRRGRRAVYDHTHLERLAEIRRLAGAGFTLAQIGRLKGTAAERTDPAARPDNDLGRLAAKAALARRLTRSEVAEQAEVPEGLVALLCDNGLLETVTVDDVPLFDQSAVSMVRAGLAISAAGVPLDELVHLAADHSGNVDDIVRRAIALIEDHVKGEPDDDGPDGGDDLVEIVRALLPAVTRLVAQHFHRTLVARALERVSDGDRRALADALVAADAEHLVVTCEWR